MAGKKRTKQREQVHNSEDKIRLRAYELFESRGREHGHDLDDWLQAEQEINRGRIHVAA